MKHTKYAVRPRSNWMLDPPVVKEFYSRRAAEKWVKEQNKEVIYDIEEIQVPAYTPKAGSPDFGAVAKEKETKIEYNINPGVVITPVADDGDDEDFNF